LIIKSLLS